MNELRAFTCFEVAAKLGHLMAKCELGDCYLTGRGTHISPKLAFEHYKDAASKGSEVGEFKVSQCYIHGIGTEQKVDKAWKSILWKL